MDFEALLSQIEALETSLRELVEMSSTAAGSFCLTTEQLSKLLVVVEKGRKLCDAAEALSHHMEAPYRVWVRLTAEALEILLKRAERALRKEIGEREGEA